MFARVAAARIVATRAAPLSRGVLAAAPQTAFRPAAPVFHAVRGFASSREDFLKRLQEEIKEETELVEQQEKDEPEKHSSPFKVVEETKNGKIVLGHEIDGYKINVTFSAPDLTYTYPEGENPICSLPVEIEIANANDLAIRVSGEIEEEEIADEEDADDDVDDAPYFTPELVQIGKPGNIPDDAFSPNLNELDEHFQDCFAEWISDFQIDRDLFRLVMDNAKKKENAIYLNWLKDMSKVVEKKN